MTLGDLMAAGLSGLWILVCGLRWWVTNPKNTGQRRFFAIAAGLGAAMFWIIGQGLWKVISSKPEGVDVINSGSEIRIQGR